MTDLLDSSEQAALSLLTPHGKEKQKSRGRFQGSILLGCSEHNKMSSTHIEAKGL
jgi:hypothetical protein